MYVHRRRTRIEIWTPAKLNLFLEVLGRRADGYHEIETLMVPISLFDTLRLSRRDDGRVHLTSRWAFPPCRSSPGTLPGEAPLPPAIENLAYRAIERLRQRAGVTTGVDLELIKRIPAAAGLGGGSSDAAAALCGGNELWELKWSRERLAELAAELGSDIPFFLYDSSAWCRGRGEQVEPWWLGTRHHFVLVCPPQGLSTAEVYSHTERVTSRRGGAVRGEAGRLRRPADLAHLMFNRLQSAAEQIAPWIRAMQQQFNRLDVLGHQMSGSGSAYFGVCRNARHSARVEAILRSRAAGRIFRAVSVEGGTHCVIPETSEP
jgi:4-diphosphocytidyl-2-C-methyl-D-erythritol kinase